MATSEPAPSLLLSLLSFRLVLGFPIRDLDFVCLCGWVIFCRVSGKRKAAGDEDKKSKRGKVGKDANKPKRPPSAFFVFM